MKPLEDPTRRAGSVGLVIGLVVLAGCSTWKPVLGPPGTATWSRHAKQARVILASRTQVDLFNPFVARDTLWGYGRCQDRDSPGWQPARPPNPLDRRVGIPISDVRFVELRHPSPGRTAGLTLGIVATTFVVGLAIGLAVDPPF